MQPPAFLKVRENRVGDSSDAENGKKTHFGCHEFAIIVQSDLKFILFWNKVVYQLVIIGLMDSLKEPHFHVGFGDRQSV